MASISEARASASRVAKWLLAKHKSGEAIELLSAWAVVGPNDTEGQALLAEALRIDARSPLAKAAFERMEGITSTHDGLDAAIAKYTEAELARLEKEVARPAFRRAQVGYNNNLKYKGDVFHVQTEDSGLDKPHIMTHLFADGGRIIKSTKRIYASEVSRPDIDLYVRSLMKGQQMEMVLALRDGQYDGIIEGRETGGMTVMEGPPNVDVRRVGEKRVAPSVPTQAAASSEDAPRARFKLQVLRSLTGGPESYEPVGDDVIVGSSGAVALEGEQFCHPSEAVIKWRNGRLTLEDLEGGNGAFLRVRTPVELTVGDEFIVGDQLLRIERNPSYDHTPGPGPTYCYSSPVGASSFRVVQLFEGGAEGACVVARGTTLYIGSGYNDMIIARDPLISEHHCLLDEQAGSIILTDLESRTGVFVRIQGSQDLRQGDELLFGRTRLQIEILPA